MRQGTRTFVKAAFATVLGVLSVPLAGFTEAQAQVPVDQPFPAYNPYPPGILPADLQPELLRFDAKFKPSSVVISQSGKH
jgi:hypothetical protein